MLAPISFCGAAGEGGRPAQPLFPPSARPDVRLEQLQPAPIPGAKAPVEVPESAPSHAPAGAEQVRFLLTGLSIEGVTAYPQAQIIAIAGGKIDHQVSLADIYGIAAEIQRKYREDGYFLTRVILPPQVIDQGRVRILVLEGFVSGIEIQGDVGPVKALIESYLQHVLAERPLKLATLERNLLLAKDIPGVDVNGILRPSPDQVGAAQLVVTATRKRFEGLALVDNIGSTFTGKWELAGSASANAFTKYGEQVTLTGLISSPGDSFSSNGQNQKVLQLGGSFRPGSQGVYVNLLGSYGDSNPGGAISQFDFNSKELLLSVVAGYPIIRSRSRNLYTELGFDYIDSNTDIFDNVKFSRDRLRVLHLNGLMDFRDAWGGASYLSLGVQQGLPILGASKSGDQYLSRPDASGVFTAIQLTASRLQQIVGNLAFFGIVSGQYAFDNLLSEVQFDVGGIRFGRGYEPKELSGDDGVGFTGELQYTRPAETAYLQRYQLFAFYDFGYVSDHGSSVSASLASAGAGVRAWFARDVSLALQVAKPLTRPSERADGTKDAQFLMRASIQF